MIPHSFPLGDLARRLRGDVLANAGDRARYATDASIYEIVPAAAVLPADTDDIAAALAFASQEGLSVTARGGGTSQAGQTVGSGLVMDFSRHMNRVLDIDHAAGIATVQPGLVLDELNRQLAPLGLWFPIDVSTSSRATLGGMAGNNSAGTRSLRYGIMRDRVVSVDAVLANGARARFGHASAPSRIAGELDALAQTHGRAIVEGFPSVSRRVGGYNVDALARPNPNYASLLVGSEGTLALTTQLQLKLSPLPPPALLGICQFPRFRQAMEAAEAIVALGPTAVEVVDRSLIALAREIAVFGPTITKMAPGDPDALLIVEFAEAPQENRRRLAALRDLMAELGLPGALVEIENPGEQRSVWQVRAAGLNIAMSMKSAGKPVSFIEDCAVPLAHLADYTEALNEIFAAAGTTGTWYAHASVGCLHVRPILNLKLAGDVAKMRSIAEATMALVKRFKGSHSGEHGDGIVRSEFHRRMYGDELVAVFGAVKSVFDPGLRLNPGRIVDPPRMDDRSLMRYGPHYAPSPGESALTWRGYEGGIVGAVEMCNNNGACRALKGGVMCPSFRATRDERDSTRGRANTLRFALAGRLGPDGLASPAVAEAMALCVSCKACRRECPTGVDMARLKLETLAARNASGGVPMFDRAVAHLPDYARAAVRFRAAFALRERVPGAARALQAVAGLAARRPLPRWQRPYVDAADGPPDGTPIILFADTFTRYFEPETPAAARRTLAAAGARVLPLLPAKDAGRRPICCGRTFLAAGMIARARNEARRFMAALAALPPDALIAGLEPSCLFTLHDEFPALLPGGEADSLATRAITVEAALMHLHYVSDARNSGPVALHGHCHQKAFGALGTTQGLLAMTGRTVTTIESGCCGMAGAFGYRAEYYDMSVRMAGLDLLPALAALPPDATIAAGGFSCRHQIADLSGRRALHPIHLVAPETSQ